MNRTPVADWQQLSALYELADALDPAALESWLAQLRTQAHPLLLQLEQMLGARSQVKHNGFLDALPRLPTAAEPLATDWSEGSRVGLCQICEEPAHAVLVAKRCKRSRGWRREHRVIRGKE